MEVPDWWEFTLLALAAWRVFHLIGHDDILDKPRRYVTRLRADWEKEGDPTGKDYREKLGAFLECPYCLGFWIALIWWVAWLIFPTETVWLAVPWAISAGVVGAHRFLSS